MTILFLLLVLSTLTALVHLRHTVRLDGYGHRPPPPSHYPYWTPLP